VLGKDYTDQDCSLARALEVVGERWTLLILRDAFYGVRRFSDFEAHLDIPKAVLSARLNGLVADGLLQRTPDPAHASRAIYELTASGRDLWPAVHALMTWGQRNRGENSRVFRHTVCATPLLDDGSCPTCGVTPKPEDITTEPRPGRKRRRHDPVAVRLRSPHRLLQPLDP
jgi:DNA-binding HxlR family transcriptional regulator